MEAPELQWWRAASISELTNSGPIQSTKNDDNRWQFWLQLPGFRDDASNDEILAPLGVTEAQLKALLSEGDSSARLEEPQWYQMYLELWRRGRPVRNINGSLDVVELFRPLLEGALVEASDRISALGGGTLQPSLISAIVAKPPVQDLAMIISPTAVLELHVMRESGKLHGAEAGERYKSFIDELAKDEVRRDLYDEYVELVRVITTRLGYWVDNRVSFAEHALQDEEEIKKLLGASELEIRDVEFGAGDSHSKGKSVAIVTTSAGKVVYKPRPNALETQFDALVAWINGNVDGLPVRAATTVGSEDHTWSEFIEHRPLAKGESAEHYVEKIGKLAGLLHVLHATDFHFENVIASGEDPVLVDLEALMHRQEEPGKDGERLQNVAYDFLANSVKKVGILPDRIIMHQEEETVAVDVSAVGGKGGQDGLVAVPTLVDVGTDTMRITDQRHQVGDQNNLPITEDGDTVDLLEHESSFIAGFDRVYRAVRDARERGDLSWLENFREVKVRNILRPTFLYGRLLMKSYHPDFLRSRLDRTLVLSKLLHGHKNRDQRSRIIEAEMNDMLNGDIPIFFTDADDGTVTSSTGALIGVELPSPFDLVSHRVDELSDRDLARQVDVCRYSFTAARVDGFHDKWPGWAAPASGTTSEMPIDGLKDASKRIAAEIMDKAITVDGEAGWLGLNLVDERWWTLSPTSADLYSGSPGILLALATIGHATGDPAITDFAVRGLDNVARQAEHMAALAERETVHGGVDGVDPGAFGFLGGPVVALNYGAALFNRPGWADSADSLLGPLSALIPEEKASDLISGSAGAIMLGKISRPSEASRNLVTAGAKKLLASVEYEGDQAVWAGAFVPEERLAGFSHGTLGIALALATALPQVPEAIEIVQAALRHETASMNEDGDTLDLREISEQRQGEMRAWCHGAAGAILGRLGLGKLSADLDWDLLKLETEASAQALTETGLLDTPTAHGIGNHCLCHGDVGNLIALSEAREWKGVGGAWSAILKSEPWLCGVPGGTYTPGLMTGLSGVGWGFAYATAPDVYPSILGLESPYGNWWM